jgi:hypothetical protein
VELLGPLSALSAGWASFAKAFHKARVNPRPGPALVCGVLSGKLRRCFKRVKTPALCPHTGGVCRPGPPPDRHARIACRSTD